MFLVQIAGIGLLFNNCNRAPVLPDTPEVEFVKAEYWDMGLQSPDSLNVTIRFQDGNGDLGLDQSNTVFPYHFAYFFSKKDTFNDVGEIQTFDAIDELITSDDIGSPDIDIPDFVDPFYCTEYITNPIIGNQVVVLPNGRLLPFDLSVRSDTILKSVFFEANPNHFNFLIDFFVKNVQGEFEQLFFESIVGPPECGSNFYARFSQQDIGTNLAESNAIEGELTYRMNSVAFPFELGNRIFKLRIRIIDRALNSSNTIETEEMTLDDIRVN